MWATLKASSEHPNDIPHKFPKHPGMQRGEVAISRGKSVLKKTRKNQEQSKQPRRWSSCILRMQVFDIALSRAKSHILPGKVAISRGKPAFENSQTNPNNITTRSPTSPKQSPTKSQNITYFQKVLIISTSSSPERDEDTTVSHPCGFIQHATLNSLHSKIGAFTICPARMSSLNHLSYHSRAAWGD